MIQVHNLSLSYITNTEQQVVCDNLSFSVHKSERIGLVGNNGSGKTTLLKMLNGNAHPDSGTINTYGSLAYLPQQVTFESDKNVLDEAICEQPDNAQHIAQAHKILTGLGFSQKMLEKKVMQLSMGWRMRLYLTKLLLKNADFYLFDEPTNHLDIVSQTWFFNFLKQAPFGFMLVAHDRYFLDNVVSKIYELEHGKLHTYNGNFSHYCAQKEQRITIQENAYKNQQREIARKKRTIERFRCSASKSKMAQSMQKALDKMEVIHAPQHFNAHISMSFGHIKQSGNIVLKVNNLSKEYNNQNIFNNAQFTLQKGDKCAIIAPNGTGKTTLCDIICKKISAAGGSVHWGHNVEWAYFQQEAARMLDQDKTIWDDVAHSCPHPDSYVRSLLGTFMFSQERVHKYISVLSGGEKNRVCMAKLLLQDANMLILDEPTNHLDLQSKDILLKALKEYPGTILFVSHDRYFVNNLATKILDLTPNGTHLYHGNYTAYLEQKEYQSQTDTNTQKLKQEKIELNEETIKEQRKEYHALRKSCKKIEEKIAKQEKELETIRQKLFSAQYGTDEFNTLYSQEPALQKSLQELYDTWETTQENIELLSKHLKT